MEFHQKPDAETGAQTHHVAPSDKPTAELSTERLRKNVRKGDPQPSIRGALGLLDSLLTKCHHLGDYKVFARHLPIEDATATRAALELIRRQTRILDAALANAEAELLEVRESQARPVAELQEGGDA
jgi:hypothetical protein